MAVAPQNNEMKLTRSAWFTDGAALAAYLGVVSSERRNTSAMIWVAYPGGLNEAVVERERTAADARGRI